MALKDELEELSSLIPVIDANRQYWFVRTEGGDYYEDFIGGNYIGIGYEEVPLQEISQAKQSADTLDKSIKNLSGRLKAIYPNEKRTGFIASQILRFTYAIRKGDIVIIPSRSSSILHFGEVQDSSIYLTKPDACPHTKRKKVRWIKSMQKWKLEAEFYKMIFSHNTISNANEYAGYIDRTLNSIFVKGDSTHLVLDVKVPGKVDVDTFYDFGEIFKLLRDFCEEEEIENAGLISQKTNVQSDGIMEIIQSNAVPIGMLALGLILNALTGGGFGGKIKIDKKGLEAEVKNEVPVGLIERIGRILKSKRDDKLRAEIVEKCLEKMKIDTPEDLAKLIGRNDENQDEKS